MYRYLVYFSLFALLGCSETSIGGPTPVPDASVTCTTSKCQGASGNFDTRIYLTLSGCAPDQIDYDLVAVSTFQSACSPTGCEGEAVSWVDEDGNSLTEIQSRSYQVCGWIDLNSDATKNTADEFSESSKGIAVGTELSLTTWGVTYSSRNHGRRR